MTGAKRIQIALHLCAGSACIAAAILGDGVFEQAPLWGPVQSAGVTAGVLLIMAGFLNEELRIARVSARLCLSILSLFATLAILEAMFWAVGFDFARAERSWRRAPPFFRQPTVPTGKVFFRRAGPEQWTGQVLNTHLKLMNVRPNPYGSEPVVTVNYDRNGFRNPESLAAWEIAVAGDSFTEMGYLPEGELFTTHLARALNVRVLNLGVSHTGPLTHLSYLQHYGLSSGTKQAVIVFYEGNDLSDLELEYAGLERWRQTGQREYRTFRKQSSFVRAAARMLERRPIVRVDFVSAYYKSEQGDVLVAFSDIPPSRAKVSQETKQYLDYFLSRYAEFGKQHDLSVWLAYMPAKRRILHGRLEFPKETLPAVRSWAPTGLPEVISSRCDRFAVRFIDLTPVLLEASEERLVYNTIDTHLNAFGSQAVARELARFLGGQGAPRRND